MEEFGAPLMNLLNDFWKQKFNDEFDMDFILTCQSELNGKDPRACLEIIFFDPAFSSDFESKYNKHINKLNGIDAGNFDNKRALKIAFKTIYLLAKQGKLGDIDLKQLTI